MFCGIFGHLKWFNQTQCVRHFKNIGLVLLQYLTSGKIRHTVFATLLCQIGVRLVIETWFNHTHIVSYSTKVDWVLLHYFIIAKADTLCYIIYCVKFGCFWSFKRGLSRHSVLAILRNNFHHSCIVWVVKNSVIMC